MPSGFNTFELYSSLVNEYMEGYMKVMNDQSEMSPSVSKEMFGIFGYTYMTTLIIIEIFELYDVLVNYRN